MIANTLFAAGVFVSLVAAIPMAQPPFAKRDVVWETHTEVALTTIPVTVTHWLEPGESAPTVGAQHYGHGKHGGRPRPGKPSEQPETIETPAPAPPASSPESAPPAPAPSSYEQPPPAQQYPPPAAPTTPEAPAPEPTTQQAPPPAYTPEPQPSPQPEPSPEQPSDSTNGLTGMAAAGKSYTGDLTYYDPGLGACGVESADGEDIVAISEAIFDAYLPASGNPNNNPLCGKYVSITGEDGSSYKAKIVDRCPGCTQGSLDLAPSFFKKVVPTGDGRVPGVDWSFA